MSQSSGGNRPIKVVQVILIVAGVAILICAGSCGLMYMAG